jgi:hypothetical protein
MKNHSSRMQAKIILNFSLAVATLDQFALQRIVNVLVHPTHNAALAISTLEISFAFEWKINWLMKPKLPFAITTLDRPLRNLPAFQLTHATKDTAVVHKV